MKIFIKKLLKICVFLQQHLLNLDVMQQSGALMIHCTYLVGKGKTKTITTTCGASKGNNGHNALFSKHPLREKVQQLGLGMMAACTYLVEWAIKKAS
jgi:hypothetical protein